MVMHPVKSAPWVSLALANVAFAHVAMYHPAMYCFNGTDPNANPNNNNAPSQPLWDLPYDQYWMHASNGCNTFPPDEGVFLELQAGSTLTAELAVNRAFTTWNTDPNAIIGTGLDGTNYTSSFGYSNGSCITEPNMHTHNQTTSAGTAIAIAYKSDITTVGIDDLVVITVAEHSPFFRVVEYDIPSGLPACPDDGCICTWHWIPDGCGEPNIYMFPYKCKVTTDSSTPKTIGSPQPPVWCEGSPSTCTAGPKQVMIWNQAEANNIEVTGFALNGENKSPAYNTKCGFSTGAQNDIFVNSSGTSSSVNPPANTAVALGLSSSSTPSFSPAPSSSPDPSSFPDPNSSPIPTNPPAQSSPGPNSFPSGDPSPCPDSQRPRPSDFGNSDPTTQRSKRMMHHRREMRNVF